MINGKSIVITGVASGIGARTAELAAEAGANVIGIDINPPAEAIGTFHQADLADPASVKALVDALPGDIDALCNIAGLSGQVGAVPTISVNFFGLRALSVGLAPKIVDGGAVVNVASIAGFGWRENLARAKAIVAVEGYPDVAEVLTANGVANEEGYPVSKELLLLWNYQAAHSDLFKSRSIRVNAVSPGPVETPILTQFREVLGDERVDSDIARVGRAGNAQDIAPTVLFLCSDDARWINGANLAVDGGLEASVLAEVMDF